MCCALLGHSPAPHGPHCPSEGSGRHGKGDTPKLPCSTRLQSDSSELGPIPAAPVSVGMEKAAPAVPSGLLQQRVTHPALPGPLETFNGSRTDTRALQGAGDALGPAPCCGQGPGSWNSISQTLPWGVFQQLLLWWRSMTPCRPDSQQSPGYGMDIGRVLKGFWRGFGGAGSAGCPGPPTGAPGGDRAGREDKYPNTEPCSLSLCHMENRE